MTASVLNTVLPSTFICWEGTVTIVGKTPPRPELDKFVVGVLATFTDDGLEVEELDEALREEADELVVG